MGRRGRRGSFPKPIPADEHEFSEPSVEEEHGNDKAEGIDRIKMVLRVGGEDEKEEINSDDNSESCDKSNADPKKHKHKKKKKKKDKTSLDYINKKEKKRKMKENKEFEKNIDEHQDELSSKKPKLSALDPSEVALLGIGSDPLQKCLNYIHALFQKKDTNGFFAFPVTDSIAPGYGSLISKPMDFSTMRDKIDCSIYKSILEYKEDFDLMCDNCCKYNNHQTIFYKEAKRLQYSLDKFFNASRLAKLRSSIPFFNDLKDCEWEPVKVEKVVQAPAIAPVKPSSPALTPAGKIRTRKSAENSPNMETPKSTLVQEKSDIKSSILKKSMMLKVNQLKEKQQEEKLVDKFQSRIIENAEPLAILNDRSMFLPETSPKTRQKLARHSFPEEPVPKDKVLAQAQAAAREAAEKLTNRQPKVKAGFLRLREDGSTSLCIMNPENEGCQSDNEKVVNLGALVGRLQGGKSCIPGFREDRRNIVSTVNYLDYGSFSSYAPIYDSSFATLTKSESELLLSTYENDLGIQYAQSMKAFVNSAGTLANTMVDNLLDILTGNAHSKMVASLKQKEMEASENAKTPVAISEQNKDSADTTEDEPGSLLDTTARLIGKLRQMQQERLSKSCDDLNALPPISDEEQALSEQLTGELTKIAKEVAPSAVVSQQGVRSAMGVQLFDSVLQNLPSPQCAASDD